MAKRIYRDLATYLAQSGDTQANVARQCDTSQSTISKLVAGEKVPRPELAQRIADYCHIPLDSFVRTYLAARLGERRSA